MLAVIIRSVDDKYTSVLHNTAIETRSSCDAGAEDMSDKIADFQFFYRMRVLKLLRQVDLAGT